MASQPSHRRDERGTLSPVLRLVISLAAALLSLPALNVGAFADDVVDDPTADTSTVPEPAAAEDPAVIAATFTGGDLTAADYIVADEEGANDEPGQKDLTQFFGFTAPEAGKVKIGWSWDEIAWSGNNTGDACALFDTDADGTANYAVCVTVTGNPATQLDIAGNPSPRLYSCNDTRVDRCAGPGLLYSGGQSTVDCEVAQTSTDPFATGDAKPVDTSALCTIPLSYFTDGGAPQLINVCSYPSQEPNSDPSDCVLIPRDALLTVNKVVTPLAAADSTSFGFTFTGAGAPAPFGLLAGGSATIPVRSSSAFSLAEDTIAGWRLVSATCTNGQEPSALNLASGAQVTCTFTNTPRVSVTVNKSWVINGTSYTNANKPTGYSATLTLTGQTNPAFGTKYTGYTQGDQVTIDEDVTVPSGCTNSVGTGNLGAKTLGAGDNVYTVTNTVTCGATVTVNKSWVINGTSYTNANKPTGYSATLTLTGQNNPAFGTKYTGYTQGQSVSVGEDVTVPPGCTNRAGGGGLGEHTLGKGDNVYTVTNTVTCGATVTVNKSWVINGTSYTNANKPTGYSATLTLTGQNNPAFGTTYTGYTQGGLVTVGETVTVPPGCTNQASGGGLGEHTLAKGDNVYAITNTVNCAPVFIPPAWNLSKTSNPASGSTVEPGASVTYTLHAVNTSFGVVAGATVTDNLADVLDNATLQTPLEAGLSVAGTTLTWAVPTMQPGQSATVSYTVTVSPDQWNATLRNVVTPSGSGGSCTPVADCTTEHFTPAWELVKISDPASGSEVEPGDTITYTLTALNTSEAVVDGAVAHDDLSEVLNNATLDEASLDAALSLSGTTLTWTIPTLQPGESASASYTVTVDTDAFNVILENVVVPVGAGGICVEAADCTTTHDTPEVLGEEVIQPRPPVVKGVQLPATGAPENGGLYGLLGTMTVCLGALLMTADRRRRQS